MIDVERLESDARTALQDLRWGIGVPEHLTLAAHLDRDDRMTYTVSGFNHESGFQIKSAPKSIEALSKFNALHPTGALLIKHKRQLAKQLLKEAHDLEIQSQ
jgi:hypothetical protein